MDCSQDPEAMVWWRWRNSAIDVDWVRVKPCFDAAQNPGQLIVGSVLNIAAEFGAEVVTAVLFAGVDYCYYQMWLGVELTAGCCRTACVLRKQIGKDSSRMEEAVLLVDRTRGWARLYIMQIQNKIKKKMFNSLSFLNYLDPNASIGCCCRFSPIKPLFEIPPVRGLGSYDK